MLGPDDYTGGVLLALDGDLPSSDLITMIRADHSTLVAADGAAIRLRERGILPDVVIGDLDSIADERQTFLSAGVLVVEEGSQETNDFEKALRWIIDRGERRGTVIGISGGMGDHALNNASVLARYARRLRLCLRDDRSIAYLVGDSFAFDTTEGDRISLIPLPSVRLTTDGLVWGLADERLAIGECEGGSNRASGSRVSLNVGEGTLLVFHYPAVRGGPA